MRNALLEIFENVETEIPITEPEVDVKLFGERISIKTITGGSFSGVKLIWTVDAQKAKEFRESYFPGSHLLLIQVNWNKYGGFFFIPLEVQKEIKIFWAKGEIEFNPYKRWVDLWREE